MNLRLLAACVLGITVVGGCSHSSRLTEPERGARLHMARADSLARASQFVEATNEYVLVARSYPATSWYPAAVLNAALLYSADDNPARDDSAALYWFRIYQTRTLPGSERKSVEACETFLTRILELRTEATKLQVVNDSLAATGRRQAAALSVQSRRIEQLEEDLRKANDELKELKEVDVRIFKRKGKK